MSLITTVSCSSCLALSQGMGIAGATLSAVPLTPHHGLLRRRRGRTFPELLRGEEPRKVPSRRTAAPPRPVRRQDPLRAAPAAGWPQICGPRTDRTHSSGGAAVQEGSRRSSPGKLRKRKKIWCDRLLCYPWKRGAPKWTRPFSNPFPPKDHFRSVSEHMLLRCANYSLCVSNV